MKKIIISTIVLVLSVLSVSAQWQSELVKMDSKGNLTYAKKDGFILPDFSHAGYKNGMDIPDVNKLNLEKITLKPLSNNKDNTEQIQKAINKVSGYTLKNGFRGIVELSAGTFYVDGIINLNKSGVILRGVNNGNDPKTSTIVYARNSKGKAKNIVVMGSSKEHNWGKGSDTDKVNITTKKVNVGDYSFEVYNASKYKQGDLICIKYPTTTALLEALYYGGNSDGKWNEGTIDISYHRYITGINGNIITVDAPIYYTLDKTYSQAYIYKITPTTGILKNVAIENIRFEFEKTPSSQKGVIDQNCVLMRSLENSWVKKLAFAGFIHSGVKTRSVTRSTIENCNAFSPSGERKGGNQYPYAISERSQLILVKNCKAKGGRHDFIVNSGGNASGIVFLDVISADPKSDQISESHRHFAQGILFDNYKTEGKNESKYALGFYLRQNMGSGHGWSATNSVMWNCNTGSAGIYLNKPPTGQNYAIGCFSKEIVRYKNPINVPGLSVGYVEKHNIAGLQPTSLYKAQLAQRKGNAKAAPVTRSETSIVDKETESINIAKVAGNTVYLNAPDSNGTFYIFGINGTLLKKTNETSATVELPSNSMYIIKYQSPNISKTEKIIVGNR